MSQRSSVPHVEAVILAGGKSSRFGSDKALYVLNGRPLIQHSIDIAKAAATLIGIVTSDELKKELAVYGSVFVDDVAAAGPVAGLLTASRIVSTQYFIVLPCDMPFVRAESLLKMTSICIDNNLMACVARDDAGRLSPLCGCYHRSISGAAARTIESEDNSGHALLKMLGAFDSTELASRELTNMNTLQDLSADQ